MKKVIFDRKLITNFLAYSESKSMEMTVEKEKKQLSFYDTNGDLLAKIRLPIDLDFDLGLIKTVPVEIKNYVLLIIRSGIATLGYFENFINVDHKVLRAYMVRKKQGMSQIKYLNKKGKSRAGSRVRLAETVEFFEDINQRLKQYFKEYRIDEIGLICAESLIPYLYGSKVKTPFSKGDPRIFKIPKHIQNPTYEALLDTNQFLLKAEFKYSELGKSILEDFLNQEHVLTDKTDFADDW